MDNVVDLSGEIQKDNQPQEKKNKKSFIGYMTALLFLGTAVILALLLYFFLFDAPSDFKRGVIVKVEAGDMVSDIGDKLYISKIISSPTIFNLVIKISGVETKLQQGEYMFDSKLNVYEVVMKISNGDYGIDEEKILIREGLSRKEMATIFSEKLPLFSTEKFMLITKDEEGYLFPDTYIFFKSAETESVVSDMKKNFNVRTSALKKESDSLSLDWTNVIKVASLVELEGKTKEDRAMISDIIYRRILANMPLQLDAPFLYYMNKASLQLTQDDLFTDSPYNTYRNKGLPPTPICSPGLDSIEAAINPKVNSYLYYLSDKDGTIHYAETFDEHKKNKKTYLNIKK